MLWDNTTDCIYKKRQVGFEFSLENVTLSFEYEKMMPLIVLLQYLTDCYKLNQKVPLYVKKKKVLHEIYTQILLDKKKFCCC